MRIETITTVYNEEILLPFYLKHYSWVDRINIIFDQDTNDKSMDIIDKARWIGLDIQVFPITFPDMLDDSLKVAHINFLYRKLRCDIVLNVDCDEFILTGREVLESKRDESVLSVTLMQPYRHFTEGDLDINRSIKEQRSHGIADCIKPIIAYTDGRAQWGPGNHTLEGKYSDILCSHWMTADPMLIVERRIKNRLNRLSQKNKDLGWGYHWEYTQEQLLSDCKAHENDSRLWI